MRTQICPRCGSVLRNGRHHILACKLCGWHSKFSFYEFVDDFNKKAHQQKDMVESCR